MELTPTEKRVLQSIHLRGCTGAMGSLNLNQRKTILYGLIEKGLLDAKTGVLTPKGIELSI